MHEATLLRGEQVFDKIPSSKRRLLQRESELDYSSDPFDFHLDGNGYTNRQVFSYWVDDMGNIQQAVGVRADITGIVRTPATSILDTATMRVTFGNGTSLLLNLPDEAEAARRFADALEIKV